MKFKFIFLLCTTWMICSLCLQSKAVNPFPQQTEPAQKQHYRITVQNSARQPQSNMILRILGSENEFISDAGGVFDFEEECSEENRRSASLYFSENPSKPVHTFQLHTITSDTILVIDGEEDIRSFRQNNQTFPIRGTVKNQSGKPIGKALVSIQGTGRKTQTDASGKFSIAADYNHSIVIRANGMMNQTLNIQYFLTNPETDKVIYMTPQNDYQVYNTVEKMPEFPGGMKAFQQYVRNNLPQQDVKENGVVIIQFIVEKDGSISSPTIARGLEAELDTLSLELVNKMPKWIPGEKDNGNKVRCRYSVPIQFKPKEPETPKPAVRNKPAARPVPAVQDSVAQDTLAIAQPEKTISPTSRDSLQTISVTSTVQDKKLLPADSTSTTVTDKTGKEPVSLPSDSTAAKVLKPEKVKMEDGSQAAKTEANPPAQKVSE